MGLPGDFKDNAVIKAIIELAHLLGMQTVAEGVETEQQLEHLRRLGSDFVQGFLLGRPAPPEDVPAIVEAAAGQRKAESPAPIVALAG
jgi:EAL domain-containing protein (putative c-di-GMP-specific phosphodiesterase class I)